MIARGFKPVGWVAAVAGAALGCYMLSLNVAAERAELASVERHIIAAKQDIRALQTELGTRGRLAQLEHWNAEVLALSAPASKQFLQNEFRLATFSQPQSTIDEQAAQVRMASAQTDQVQPAPKRAVGEDFKPVGEAQETRTLIRRASLVLPSREEFSEAPAPAKAKAAISTPIAKAPPKPQAVRSELAKLGAAKPAAQKAPVKTAPTKKPGLLDEDVLGEIGAVARQEKQAGGTAGR
jgi:hypothetical protein